MIRLLLPVALPLRRANLRLVAIVPLAALLIGRAGASAFAGASQDARSAPDAGVVAPAGSERLPAAERVDPEITRGDLQRTLRFLADDARAGRSTGSQEAMECARWLAQRLEAADVSPGGDEGTFLQHVPMARMEYQGLPTLQFLTASGERVEAVYGVDFEFPSGALAEVELSVARVANAADLAAIPADARASTAVFLDAPPSDRRALQKELANEFPLTLIRGRDRPGRTPLSEVRGAALPAEFAAGGLPPASLRLNGPLLERLSRGEFARLRARIEARRVEQPAANVIGVIRGVGTAERPDLARQAIVFSAHYDHIGLDSNAADGQDRVYNGADDDASGCAAVLELAEALAVQPRPARTLVFLFATGEEIGLVGTRHYIDHPLVALDQTVCNLNFEMIGRPDAKVGGSGKLWLTGFERSNLGPSFRALGMQVETDPRPEQHFFERSDNIAFAYKGIVAQTLSSYDLHTDYHKVSDEVAGIDFAHLEAAVRDALIGARALAAGSLEPVWSEGGAPTRR